MIADACDCRCSCPAPALPHQPCLERRRSAGVIRLGLRAEPKRLAAHPVTRRARCLQGQPRRPSKPSRHCRRSFSRTRASSSAATLPCSPCSRSSPTWTSLTVASLTPSSYRCTSSDRSCLTILCSAPRICCHLSIHRVLWSHHMHCTRSRSHSRWGWSMLVRTVARALGLTHAHSLHLPLSMRRHAGVREWRAFWPHCVRMRLYA